MRARFGSFVLDTERRELLRDGKPVHLPPKAFQLLARLVEKRPHAVSQQDLYDHIWPGTFVRKESLHNLMSQVREALDDRDQAIIRTVYGFGFSFAAPVVGDDAPASAQWQIVVGDREFDLHAGENIVGRDRGVAVRIDSTSISRRHARIVVTDDSITVEDLRSKNGTIVRGKRIHSVSGLGSGERVIFGTIAAILRAVPGAPSTETAGEKE